MILTKEREERERERERESEESEREGGREGEREGGMDGRTDGWMDDGRIDRIRVNQSCRERVLSQHFSFLMRDSIPLSPSIHPSV